MRVFWLVAACCVFFSTFSHAMALRVSPVLLDVVSPGNVSQITLRNDQSRPLAVQLRLFRWHQADGAEKLEPTTNVVVSPPMMMLKPNQDYVVRIVRLSKQPVVGQESYRLIADELPDTTRRLNGSVVFALRQSIPVFFTAANARPPALDWSAKYDKGVFHLTVRNRGERRVRIANAVLKDSSGAVLSQRPGLVGYALGGSTTQWKMPASRGAPAGALRLDADSESGPINAMPVVDRAR